MKYTLKMFTQSTQRAAYAVALTFILTLGTGCVSVSTVSNVGNTLLDEIGDVNIFTDAEEQQFGKEFVAQHDKQVTFHTDPSVTNYINDLGQTLVRHSKRNDIPYTFRVVETKGVNAYAVPGGYIYVHLDLIRMAKTESELAAVLGHEIGHIVGRHSMKRLTKAYGIEILKRLLVKEDSGEFKKLVADVLSAGLLFKYSREDERESDMYGVQNVYDAGISPAGAGTFFDTLRELQGREPSSLELMLSTHPASSERARNVRAQISGLPPKSGLREDSSRFQQVKRRVSGR